MKIRNAGGCLWIAPAMLWAGAALSNTDADPEGNTYRYEVPGFWNSTVATMESQLHITNPTAAVGNMEIRGYYKNAVQADGVFSGRIGPKWSVDLGAREIEEGGGGISEDGIGPAYADFPRWFLVVTSDQRLVVRHLVRHEGVWRNFSAAGRPADGAATDTGAADPATGQRPHRGHRGRRKGGVVQRRLRMANRAQRKQPGQRDRTGQARLQEGRTARMRSRRLEQCLRKSGGLHTGG